MSRVPFSLIGECSKLMTGAAPDDDLHRGMWGERKRLSDKNLLVVEYRKELDVDGAEFFIKLDEGFSDHDVARRHLDELTQRTYDGQVGSYVPGSDSTWESGAGPASLTVPENETELVKCIALRSFSLEDAEHSGFFRNTYRFELLRSAEPPIFGPPLFEYLSSWELTLLSFLEERGRMVGTPPDFPRDPLADPSVRRGVEREQQRLAGMKYVVVLDSWEWGYEDGISNSRIVLGEGFHEYASAVACVDDLVQQRLAARLGQRRPADDWRHDGSVDDQARAWPDSDLGKWVYLRSFVMQWGSGYEEETYVVRLLELSDHHDLGESLFACVADKAGLEECLRAKGRQ